MLSEGSPKITSEQNQVITLKNSDMSPKDGSSSGGGADDIPTIATCNQTLGNPTLSASSPSTTTMTSLSIVGRSTIEPMTTTTTTITIQSTSVSTHGNLIGKMINDVSTTMIDRPNSVEAALQGIAKLPATAAANHEIVGDFPSNEEKNDNNNDTTTTDASNMTNTITATTLLESAEELTSTVSKLTTISAAKATTTTTTTTELCAVKCATHERQRMATIINEMKSKSTENKCQPEELATVSYQRELEANSTKSAATTEGILAKFNWSKIQLQNLDTNSKPHKGLISLKDQQLTLAARNAKLKLEFFENPCYLEQNKHKSPALTKVSKKTEESIIQVGKVINYPELKQLSCAQTNRGHSRKLTNLRLRIPERVIKSSTTRAVLESSKLSLIAQRKAELSRRFEEQSAIKTSTSQSKKSNFPSVAQLKLKYDHYSRNLRINSMIVNPNNLSDISSPERQLLKPSDNMEQRHSPLSDEGCNLGQSPYSSDDNEDNESIRTTSTILERKRKDKVARSASSDSALGLEVDDPMSEIAAVPPQPQQQQQRRMTLTVTDLPLRPALLPLAEPTALPDSPTPDHQATSQSVLLSQTVVPSKVLLEERVVEIPEDPRYIGGCCSLSSSRRESAQSCISDYPNSECSGVRFVRTPSVVVSDYSDEAMCGITLEEIEYFRAQRMRRRRSSLDTSGTEKDGEGAHSDVSASSSCSNLYYCGSTISALDGAECFVNGIRMPLPERKASDCSTCSASGEEEDAFTIQEQPEDTTGQMGKDLADLLAAQHLSTKRPKKVGITEDCIGLGVGMIGFKSLE